jgi:hypothetical protein
MIGLDNQLGDDGIYPCECRHTTRDLAQDGIDDVAVRWRELVDSGNGKPNRVTKDETVFYALKQGAFVGAAWRRSDLRNADVQAALCRTAMKNPLRKGNGSRKDLRHQDPGLLPCLSASVGVGLGRLLVRKRRKQRRMHQRLKLRVAILEVHHELWAIGIDRGLVHGRLFNRRGAGFLVHDSRLHDHG